jgi:hypothetical protein
LSSDLVIYITSAPSRFSEASPMIRDRPIPEEVNCVVIHRLAATWSVNRDRFDQSALSGWTPWA